MTSTLSWIIPMRWVSAGDASHASTSKDGLPVLHPQQSTQQTRHRTTGLHCKLANLLQRDALHAQLAGCAAQEGGPAAMLLTSATPV